MWFVFATFVQLWQKQLSGGKVWISFGTSVSQRGSGKCGRDGGEGARWRLL